VKFGSVPSSDVCTISNRPRQGRAPFLLYNQLDTLYNMVGHASHRLTAQLTGQAANSQGIQTLLEAEKEAAKVVQKARQCESFP
jgi:hypothetical protein